MLHRRVLLTLFTSFAIVASQGCVRPPVDTRTYWTPRPTTPSPEATAPSPEATATHSQVELAPASSAEEAAAALLAAWRAGDRDAASRVARAPAVEALFAQQPGPTQGRGCDQASTGHDCVYRFGDRLLRIRAMQSDGGWVVDQVEVT